MFIQLILIFIITYWKFRKTLVQNLIVLRRAFEEFYARFNAVVQDSFCILLTRIRQHTECMYALKINALHVAVAPTSMMCILHRHLFAIISSTSWLWSCETRKSWGSWVKGQLSKGGSVAGKRGKGDAGTNGTGHIDTFMSARRQIDAIARKRGSLRVGHGVKIFRSRGRNDYRSWESKKTYACTQP